MCRSVPQMDAASIRTSTSSGPGDGTGTSSSVRPGADSRLRMARIVSTALRFWHGDSGRERGYAEMSVSVHRNRRTEADEAVDALGFALGETHAAVRRGERGHVGRLVKRDAAVEVGRKGHPYVERHRPRVQRLGVDLEVAGRRATERARGRVHGAHDLSV